MAKKDPERKAETRKRIMDAYWSLYCRGASRAVTVSAVVEAAGVHRSTFYECFHDASAVLVAIEDELAEIYRAEAAAALENGGGDPGGIVQRVYVGHGSKLSVLLGAGGDPSFVRKVKDSLAPLAENGHGLGKDAFAPYRFEFVISGILAAATLWYERGQISDRRNSERGYERCCPRSPARRAFRAVQILTREQVRVLLPREISRLPAYFVFGCQGGRPAQFGQ